MKRTLTLVSLIILVVTALVLFAACDKTDETDTTTPSVTTSGKPSSGTTEPGHTHEYTESVVAPTCTEKGYTLHTCSCGDNYRDNEVAATGHTEVVDAAKPATRTETGLTEGKHCSVCGEVLVKQDIIPATGSLGLAYTVNPNGTSCTVTGIGTCTETEVIISNKIDGYNVTDIGSAAFYNCAKLTSITIPDSVTSIDDSAFWNCSGLTTVDVSSGNTKYHSSGNCIIETASKTLISGCKTSVIPADGSVTGIGKYAFFSCTGLTNITIPDSVTSIGESTFCGCTGLVSITIGNSVTSIVGSAFWDCTGLTTIDVSSKNTKYHSSGNCIIETASKTLISGCKASVIPSDGSVSGIGINAFFECTGLTSITIPDSVTGIGDSAFLGCTGLTSITIGNGVTNIGDYAFRNCSGLTSITIPDSVTGIGDSAFGGCTGLTTIVVSGGNKKYHSSGNCIIETTSKTLISGCNTSVIPADGSVTSIGNNAFRNYSGLTSITIPDSVTGIGGSAFSKCIGLTSITIPGSVTSIGDSAFSGCARLVHITNLSKCSSDVLGLSNAEQEIRTDDSVAFVNTLNTDSNGLITYQVGEKKYAVSYIGTASTLNLTDKGITDIYPYAFCNCEGLTSITIGNGVTSIGNNAFSYCAGLSGITIPDGVTSIGNSTFSYCTGLKSITIPDSVTGINSSVFFSCSGLTSITFQGTKALWNALPKGGSWNYNTGAYTIHCTDGDLKK